MKHVIILRGLPGSGKSTLAQSIPGLVCSADDFFYGEDGKYRFNAANLAQAHAACQEKFTSAIGSPACSVVVVDNTHTQMWEMQFYLRASQVSRAQVTVVSLFDGGLTDAELAERNSHGVPISAIKNMRARFEHDWKSGNPLPPWER